jgi:hypothetical protein
MNSVKPRIIVPNQKLARVYHHMAQGLHAYDEDSLYTPDSDLWKSCVLNLTPPLKPQTATAPTQYWFDRSRYQNHMTITGATWKRLPSGVWVLSLDGNDYLSNATADFRSADSQGAIEVWFRVSIKTAPLTIVSSSDTADDLNFIRVFVNQTTGCLVVRATSGGTGNGIEGSTDVSDGKWHHAVFSSNSTSFTIILDGVVETVSVTTGSNNGDWFADVAGRDNLTIGVLTRTSSIQYLTGEIGFTRIYSRPMLQPEARLNYLATRWRYQ